MRNVKSAVFLCSFLAEFVNLPAQARTLSDNLTYRASWGDLGPLTPAPFKTKRALRIQSGGENLLNDCLSYPEKWRQDPLISRFGHGHPFTTIGCRERSSPSMHVVFYRQPDGSRQAWIHFDRYSPGNLPGHAAEVIQNRLTVGRTSQVEIYRHLLMRRDDPLEPIPPRRYDLGQHAEGYLKSMFSPGSLAAVVIVGGESALVDATSQYGRGFESYSNHLEASMVRHVLEQTLEFGFGAALQQDETFATSTDERFARRVKAALFHSFFVPGREGDEFAFPRFAAAVGTAWVTHEWHPWQSVETRPWRDGALLLSAYMGRSFWHEFRPDIKSRMHMEKRKLLRQSADEPLLSTAGATRCSVHCK